MIVLTPVALALAAMMLAIWLGASIWAVRAGLVTRLKAKAAQKQLDDMADLLHSAPAIPVIVRPDGRMEAPERFASWLGIDTVPAFVSELTATDGSPRILQLAIKIVF